MDIADRGTPTADLPDASVAAAAADDDEGEGGRPGSDAATADAGRSSAGCAMEAMKEQQHAAPSEVVKTEDPGATNAA